MKTLSNPKLSVFKFWLFGLLLVAMMLFLAGTAFAQVPDKNKKPDKMPEATLKETKVTARVITSVEEVSPMNVRLNVLNPTGKTVRISILDYGNEPVFQDAFTGKEYNKTLNFKYTPDGRYKLLVNGSKQSDSRRFALDSKQNRNLNESESATSSNSDILASIHKIEPTKIKLHLVNNTGEGVKYIFRNNAKEEIYSGFVKKPQFVKIFDMAEVKDGKYTLEVDYKTDKVAAKTFDMQTIFHRSFAWTDKQGKPLKATSKPAVTQ